MSNTQVIRQLLLDLLTEYQELEKPANPELLKLHIEAYEDRIEALIQEQVRLARIDELKQLEPPEQYEEYAKIAGTDACYICGFNVVLFRKVIANRIKELKNE